MYPPPHMLCMYPPPHMHVSSSSSARGDQPHQKREIRAADDAAEQEIISIKIKKEIISIKIKKKSIYQQGEIRAADDAGELLRLLRGRGYK